MRIQFFQYFIIHITPTLFYKNQENLEPFFNNFFTQIVLIFWPFSAMYFFGAQIFFISLNNSLYKFFHLIMIDCLYSSHICENVQSTLFNLSCRWSRYNPSIDEMKWNHEKPSHEDRFCYKMVYKNFTLHLSYLPQLE